MGLTDLPLELLWVIVEQLVKSAGIQLAWHSRNINSESPLKPLYLSKPQKLTVVSETLRECIMEEIFGRQPMSVYSEKGNHVFFKRHLALFLEYRATSKQGDPSATHLYGAPAALPHLIKKIVDTFMINSDDATPQHRRAWTRGVSAVITDLATNPGALKLATRPTLETIARFSGLTGKEEALAISIVLEYDRLTQRLLNQNVSPWVKIVLFESYPLEYATKRGEITIVRDMLTRSHGGTTSDEKRLRKTLVRRCVELALDRNDGVAAELLRWYVTYGDRRPGMDWFNRAWKAGQVQFLSTLLEPSQKKEFAGYRDAFLGHSRYVDTAVVIKLFLDKGLFHAGNINNPQPERGDGDGKETSYRGENVRSQSLLDISVHVGEPQVVQMVLDSGAHPDGVMLRQFGLSYPIIDAELHRRTDIVSLLIIAGADLAAGGQKAEDWVANRGLEVEEVWRMLREAF